MHRVLSTDGYHRTKGVHDIEAGSVRERGDARGGKTRRERERRRTKKRRTFTAETRVQPANIDWSKKEG